MIELAVGTVLLAGLVWWRVVIEWKAYRRRVALLRTAEEIRKMARVMGEQLVPAVQQMAEVFAGFAAVFK